MATKQHALLTGADLHVPQAHASQHVNGDSIQVATAAQKGLATASQITKLDAIEAAADVTNATNVAAAGAIMDADYNAHTVLVAQIDDTPVPLTIADNTLIGKIGTGDISAIALTNSTVMGKDGSDDISALSMAALRIMLNVGDGADETASNAPQAHQLLHNSGGSDAIKLDDLAATDDNTDLNTSITAHGLTPKLSNVASQFLNGTGGWTVPTTTMTDEEVITATGRDLSSFDMSHNIFNKMTDPRLLFLMESDPNTGTMSDWSSKSHTGTLNGSMVSGDRINVGRVHMFDLNGTSQYISIADHNDFSFGNGTEDEAVTFAAVIEVGGTDTANILSKYGTSNKEYVLDLVAGKLMLKLLDESAAANIEMTSDAVLSVGKHFVVATYDATEAYSGITLYVDGVAVAATGSLTGTYTAMENLTASFRVGATGLGAYFPNDIGFMMIDGSTWAATTVWAIWLTVKANYDL